MRYCVWNMLSNREYTVESDSVQNALYTVMIDTLGLDWHSYREEWVKGRFTLVNVSDERDVFCVIGVKPV